MFNNHLRVKRIDSPRDVTLIIGVTLPKPRLSRRDGASVLLGVVMLTLIGAGLLSVSRKPIPAPAAPTVTATRTVRPTFTPASTATTVPTATAPVPATTQPATPTSVPDPPTAIPTEPPSQARTVVALNARSCPSRCCRILHTFDADEVLGGEYAPASVTRDGTWIGLRDGAWALAYGIEFLNYPALEQAGQPPITPCPVATAAAP